VGYVAADAGLYPLLTGWENLEFFAGLSGTTGVAVRARAGPWTGVLGLDDSALNRATGTWSSGMRQKLSLVRALWAAPDALLLDEPTAHVDPDVVVAVTAALRRAADSGVAVLWATHDLAAAHAICDRIVVLDRTVIREVRGSGEAIRGLSGLA
jgi:ABC-2 type transport system ATP-binding protein